MALKLFKSVKPGIDKGHVAKLLRLRDHALVHDRCQGRLVIPSRSVGDGVGPRALASRRARVLVPGLVAFERCVRQLCPYGRVGYSGVDVYSDLALFDFNHTFLAFSVTQGVEIESRD